jgi:hypothetical protein
VVLTRELAGNGYPASFFHYERLFEKRYFLGNLIWKKSGESEGSEN